MIRYSLFLVLILGLIAYSRRDWYVALCGVVVLTAFSEYPATPRLTSIPGVTFWSVTLCAVFLVWLTTREGRWDIPRGWLIVLGLYVVVGLAAVSRTLLDLDAFASRAVMAGLVESGSYDATTLLIDYLYVPCRYILIGFMLMDGARTRRRLWLGIGAVVLTGLVYALIINKHMPLSGLMGASARRRDRVGRETGIHPNDVAVFLGTTFWITLAILHTMKNRKWIRLAAPAVIVVVLMALLYTYSRAGYIAFAGVGVVYCLVNRAWKTLGVIGLAAAGVCVAFPSVPARLLTGFGVQTVTGDTTTDMEEVTAGRWTEIWPAAIEGIAESPLIGYGLCGFVMSPALEAHIAMIGYGAPHPHNAYLEALLDVGALGLPVVLAPLVYVLVTGCVLVRKRPGDRILNLAGLAGVVAASTMLIQGLSGQHFGFHENMFFFWCIAGLVARAGAIAPPSLRPARPTSFVRHNRQRQAAVALPARQRSRRTPDVPTGGPDLRRSSSVGLGE